jgi:RHS repeat-associated protein
MSYTYTSFSQVHTRTDARGVVTTNTYDALHRLTGIEHNVSGTTAASTPSVTLAYGTSAGSYNKGRLISVTASDGVAEQFTYDQLGRITQARNVIDSVNYDVGYEYWADGSLKALVYPSGRRVEQNYDAIGRLTQIASSGASYLTVPSGGYNAAGLLTSVTYGNSVQGTFTYNPRLQLESLKYQKDTTDLLHVSYGYGSGNNGQIRSITNQLNSDLSTSYSYDALGRLKEAQTASLTAANTWKLGWEYDRYGNRLSQNLLDGTLSVSAPQLTISATTNRITTSGYSYDAAGNMTNDALNAYTYDAENRVVSVNSGNTATYTYSGPLRVKKVAGSTTTRYIFSGSKVVAEYVNGVAVSSPTREYVYAGGQLVATHEGSALKYHHPDHLSTRVETNSSGTAVRTFGHLPFGESWYETGTADKWKFTSYERDSESGLDQAIFRYHSSRLGRFMSPDLLAGNIFSPQSLNRYAYVNNDPINLVDPLGLSPHDAPNRITVPGSEITVSATALTIAYLGVGASRPVIATLLDGGESGGSGPGDRDVERQWTEEFDCFVNAQELMSIIKKNFATWASNNFVNTFASFKGKISKGETVEITTGVIVPDFPLGITVLTRRNLVTVASEGPNSFTFETVRGKHFFYPGTIDFAVADSSAGRVKMWITASGTFNSAADRLAFVAGGFAAESATWRHLFSKIQEFCSTGHGG